MRGRDDGSASIVSSVLDYEFENGRRYHAYKAGRKYTFVTLLQSEVNQSLDYPLPNDEVSETAPNDLKHYI